MAHNPAQAEELVRLDIAKNYDYTKPDDIPMEIHGVQEVSGPVYRVLTELKLVADKQGLRREFVLAASNHDEAKQKALVATLSSAQLTLAHLSFTTVNATVLGVEEVEVSSSWPAARKNYVVYFRCELAGEFRYDHHNVEAESVEQAKQVVRSIGFYEEGMPVEIEILYVREADEHDEGVTTGQ